MKLLKSLLVFAVLAAGLVTGAVAGDHSYTLTFTTNAYLLPAALSDKGTLPAWATNTVYSQGDVVINSENFAYMCLVAGTSGVTTANMPRGLGLATNDNPVKWFKAHRGKNRTAWLVQRVAGDGTLVYGHGAASSGEGVILSSSDLDFYADGGVGVWQGPVKIVTTNIQLRVTDY